MVTIVLADDHQVVRQGLSALLSAEADLNVVAEAGTGPEAVRLTETLKPDVLIVDLRMPVLGGLEVARQVAQRSRRTRIIVLSMYVEESYVAEALRLGAAGYVSKDASAAELTHAVREVLAGRRYLSAPLELEHIEGYLARQSNNTLDLYDTLTNREREVLHLLAQGRTSAEIAAQLTISRRTAETHRANVMRKLALNSQAELARYAIRRVILPLEE